MASTWKLTKKLKETHISQAFLRSSNSNSSAPSSSTSTASPSSVNSAAVSTGNLGGNSGNTSGTHTQNSSIDSSASAATFSDGTTGSSLGGPDTYGAQQSHSGHASHPGSHSSSNESRGGPGVTSSRTDTLVPGGKAYPDELATPRGTVSASQKEAASRDERGQPAPVSTNKNPALLRVKISEVRDLQVPADVRALLPSWALDPTSTRPPPVHMVLEYDKTEILLHAIGGTATNPIWDKTSAFDLSNLSPPLNIQLYVRVYEPAAGSEERDPVLAINGNGNNGNGNSNANDKVSRASAAAAAAASVARSAAAAVTGFASPQAPASSVSNHAANPSSASASASAAAAAAASNKSASSTAPPAQAQAADRAERSTTTSITSTSSSTDKRLVARDVLLGSVRLALPRSANEPPLHTSVALGPGQAGTLRLSCEIHNTRNHPLGIDDFTLLKVVGKGSFGKVMQVRKNDTRQIYALKTIRKAHIVSRSEVGHTLAERTVLAKINNPFIVPLKFSFQSPEKLYLVLAFVNGGELFHHLQREGRFDLNRSRFYTAELLCALECLHEYNVIYRDLKPENILLDYTGHIALCDFGLCKLNMKAEQKTNTFCGTPEYLAPELLLGLGYTKAVDWWTLGVLFYEMLTGLPPFYDQDTNTMYHKIVQDPLTFPSDMDREARSLLQGLLERDPKRRLGVNGAAEIKAHPFFRQIDWKYLLNKKYVAPFQPSVVSATDTSNFDQEFTSEVPTDSVVGADSLLSESVQKQFGGWSYTNDSRLASSGRW